MTGEPHTSDEQKRICFLFLGDIHTDRRIKNFIKVFSSHNWECDVIYATPGKSEVENYYVDGANLKQLLLANASGPAMFREYNSALRKELKQRPKYDAIFSCELYSLRGAAFLKKRSGGKLLYDAREIYTGLPSLIGKPLKRWLWKRWEASGLLKTDILLITAPNDGDEIKRIHRFLPRSFLIRNLPLASMLPARNDYLRRRFTEISESRKILVYVGGIQEGRGLREMIHAMLSLRENTVLVLIGSGSLTESLQFEVKELALTNDVLFHPPVDSEEVLAILASADIGISLVDTRSLSYSFALPSKIFEYMPAGLPVLTTDLSEVKALLGQQDWVRYTSLDVRDIIINLEELAKLSEQITLIQSFAAQFSFESDVGPLFDLLNS